MDWLFHPFMRSVVDSCMCPDQGSNLQPWRIGMVLQPTELTGQGLVCFLCFPSVWPHSLRASSRSALVCPSRSKQV